MIVLFKVVLLIFTSTNTDLEWNVTNFSKIDAKFTSFCYFVDKLISAISTKLRVQESTKRRCVLSPICQFPNYTHTRNTWNVCNAKYKNNNLDISNIA